MECETATAPVLEGHLVLKNCLAPAIGARDVAAGMHRKDGPFLLLSINLLFWPLMSQLMPTLASAIGSARRS